MHDLKGFAAIFRYTGTPRLHTSNDTDLGLESFRKINLRLPKSKAMLKCSKKS